MNICFPLKICTIETDYTDFTHDTKKEIVYVHNWYNNKTKYIYIKGNKFNLKTPNQKIKLTKIK